MRSSLLSTKISLALAVVATVAGVGGGLLILPADSSGSVASAAGDAGSARAGAVSRGLERPSASYVTTGPVYSSTAPTPVPAPVEASPTPTDPEPPPARPTAAVESPAPVAPPPVAVPAAPVALPPYKLRRPAATLRQLPPGPVPGDPFTFQIGTLNILGSQHQGNGTGRAANLAWAIQGRGVDLVGLQEVQSDQLAVLQSRLSDYTVWPGQALGNQGLRLQIAFRNSLFELVDSGSIITVFDHQQRPIPWVKLRDRASGGEFYVVDIHNSPGAQSADRYSATTQEIALVRQLQASGDAVLLMGDTNEHTETACRFAASAAMIGSNGLQFAGGCNAGAGPIKIDHILGSGPVSFAGHVVDYGAPVAASTDHAFVHASVTVTPLVDQADAADLD